MPNRKILSINKLLCNIKYYCLVFTELCSELQFSNALPLLTIIPLLRDPSIKGSRNFFYSFLLYSLQ